MLPKAFRITSDRDFSFIYRKGRKFRGQYGMLNVLFPLDTNSVDKPKFGFVVSAKIGNAVVRHQYKRRLRAVIIQLLKDENFIKKLSGAKVTFIAHKLPESFEKLEKEVQELFRVARVL